jgi:adenine specific DNA methylase Mod
VIAVYINNIIIIRRYRLIIQEFKRQLNKKFYIKDLGEATDYLDIEIVRDRAAGIFKIY